MLTPTEEQQAICNFIASGRGNLLVQALAGSAKTSTLKMAAPLVKGEALALAFNKKIADALSEALPKNFTCKTFNSIGHSAWGRTVGKRLKLDTGKARRMVAFCPAGPDRDAAYALLNAARTLGLVPEGPRHIGVKRFLPDTTEGWETCAELAGIPDLTALDIDNARRALISSIEESYAGTIDFNDQIYMTAAFSGALPRFPTIFVDEAQDLSLLQHYMAKKMASGRVICVGDVNQAIYKFRGSESDSMNQLLALLNAEVLPLTMCFRCSKSVIQSAQRFTPEMRWSESAPIGSVRRLEAWSFDDIEPDSFVLCRNNAPLVKLAFAALAEGRSIKFNGREIGLRVIRFVERTDAKRNLERADLLAAAEIEIAALPQAKQAQAEEIYNILENIPGRNTREILAKLDELLNATCGNITFSSIHGAKGLEAPTAYILDSWRMPSKYAKTPEQIQQENNLHYVAVTRAQHALFYIDMDGWKETL